MQDYIDVFLHSLFRSGSQVSEIIFVNVDGCENSETTYNGVPCRTFGFPFANFEDQAVREWILQICGHALGLHYAIDRANNPYVWLTDPDVFFFNMPVDRIYLDLMEHYDLNIVGVSHFNSSDQCYLDFPCVTNCMIKKDTLPSTDWLKGELHFRTTMKLEQFCNRKTIMPMDGKYLLPGPIDGLAETFPNPQGFFDVGCNLWFWNQNKRWLSFKPRGAFSGEFTYENYGFREMVYPMNYNLCDFRANFELKDSSHLMGNHPDLLYHRTRGGRESGKEFKELYESVIGEKI